MDGLLETCSSNRCGERKHLGAPETGFLAGSSVFNSGIFLTCTKNMPRGNEKKVNYWIDNGAQPTHTVYSLFRREGLIYKRNLTKKGIQQSEIEEKMNLFFENRKTKLETEKAKKLRRKQVKAKKRKEAAKKEEK